MEREDWASVVDMTKEVLSKSDYLRVVEVPRTLAKKEVLSASDDRPDLIVLVSYGIANKERKVFVRLLELSSGQTVFSAESEGRDLRAAIEKSLSGLDEWLLTQAWRCRVIGVRNEEVIINRGYLDGLREGAKLNGYSVGNVPKDSKESDEAVLLKYGTQAGAYIVTEVRNNFAKVKSSEGKRTLREGDILEMPEIRLIERNVKTRGSRIWDSIYK